MCDNMWYLGSFGDDEKIRLTMGAASARPVQWRQRQVSRACRVKDLLSDFPPRW